MGLYSPFILDPNGDNYSESNLSGKEYNGDYDSGEQARNYINESLADDDANKQIDYEEYYSNVSNYSLSYIPFVKSPDACTSSVAISLVSSIETIVPRLCTIPLNICASVMRSVFFYFL